MRLKKYILQMIFAGLLCLIGLGSVIFHYCLKSEHSLICYFINAFQLGTLALGALYLFRGYKKDDRAILKTFIATCLVCCIAELIYCVDLAKVYPIFSKFMIAVGSANIAILSALLFAHDSPKLRTMIFCYYSIGSTVACTIAFAFVAKQAIFIDGDVATITTLLDLVNCIGFSCILLISEYLKFKDKEETKGNKQ